MGRDQREPDAGQFEWVNVWASASGATTDVTPTQEPAQPLARESEPVAAPERAPTAAARFVAASRAFGKAAVKRAAQPAPQLRVPLPVTASPIGAVLPDQLMRDIAEIERARDALAAGPFSMRRLRTFMVVPARTTESVPLAIGGVLALVMLTMFGAAAAVTKFGR